MVRLRPQFVAALALLTMTPLASSLPTESIRGLLPSPDLAGLRLLGPLEPDAPVFLDPLLSVVLAAGPQPVILVLDAAQQGRVLERLEALGLDHHLYAALHMVAVRLDAETLDVVAAIPGVLVAYRNEPMQALLDRSADYVGATTVWDTYGYTGHGVTVAVMDSGIDGSHPDIRYGANLVENVVPTKSSTGLVDGSRDGVVSSDPDGHGTHVAGIIAGTGRAMGGAGDAPYLGVAYQAKLVGFQAGLLDDEGEVSFESLTVLEGFNWALEHRQQYGIDIVSNSWGANGEFDPRSPVNLATLNLYKAGLVVIFAAGNEGDEGGHTLNKYAVAPWVLSVAAGDYLNAVPSFSSTGTDPQESGLAYDHPDVVAPGVGITSARSLQGTPVPTSPSGFYSAKSGSSMATPHVTGVAALLLEANPDLSPDDVMDILTATTTPMPKYEAWEAGAGYLNGLKGLQLAAKADGHRGEFLSGKVKYAGPASGDPAYARDAVSVGWGKGSAHRLRSPDKSMGEFLSELATTTQGLVFVTGAIGLGLLAFGPGDGPAGRPASRSSPSPLGPSPSPHLRVLARPPASAARPSSMRILSPPNPARRAQMAPAPLPARMPAHYGAHGAPVPTRSGSITRSVMLRPGRLHPATSPPSRLSRTPSNSRK